jgi:hypothetical protein
LTPYRKAFAPGQSVLFWIAVILVGCGLLYWIVGPPGGTPVDKRQSERGLGRTDPQAAVTDDASGTFTASFEATGSTESHRDESFGGDPGSGDGRNALDEYLELLPQAEAGDGAARYRLAKLIQSCRFQPRTPLDAENVHRDHNLALEPRDRLARELDRCGGLAQKIDDLESAANGWLDQAVAGEDPLALAELAVRDLWAASPVMTRLERARRIQEALRARPREALSIANQFVANSTAPANVAANWVNDAWWLATCAHLNQCDRAKVMNHVRLAYKAYEVDEILRLEATIDRAVRTGIWSDETFAQLWIVEFPGAGP